jgi:hypothetical protein
MMNLPFSFLPHNIVLFMDQRSFWAAPKMETALSSAMSVITNKHSINLQKNNLPHKNFQNLK